MTRSFGLTFDYLCPFARNVNEYVLSALRAGADWDVTFQPYSLAQGHVEEGEPAVWGRDDVDEVSGLLALQVGIAVRDHHPEQFPAVHHALFAARHDHGHDLKDPEVVWQAVRDVGIDPEVVRPHLEDGSALKTVQAEHEAGVRDYEVWGVPTFIAGGRGVFVRLLDRPSGDGQRSIEQIDRILDLVEGVPNLHEFKQSNLPM